MNPTILKMMEMIVQVADGFGYEYRLSVHEKKTVLIVKEKKVR